MKNSVKMSKNCSKMHKILHKFTKTLKNRANNPHIASRMSYIDGEFIVHLKKTKPISNAMGAFC